MSILIHRKREFKWYQKSDWLTRSGDAFSSALRRRQRLVNNVLFVVVHFNHLDLFFSLLNFDDNIIICLDLFICLFFFFYYYYYYYYYNYYLLLLLLLLLLLFIFKDCYCKLFLNRRISWALP